MCQVPKNLRYRSSHEWVLKNSTGNYTVGITHHAQELLGDIVFIDLPKICSIFNLGDECAIIESVKAATSVYTPLSGKILTVNNMLIEKPELINTSPYVMGWLFKLQASNESEINFLLDANDYQLLTNSSNP
ncbi:MAG: glycine cleavage system protein GcvH [Candidatus Dasytiphilus stammeri]